MLVSAIEKKPDKASRTISAIKESQSGMASKRSCAELKPGEPTVNRRAPHREPSGPD